MDRAEGGVDGEALGTAEAAFQRVAVATDRMQVTHGRPLRQGLPEHVGIARIEALERAAAIAGGEGRDEVVLQPDVEHVAPERRAVLLADNDFGTVPADRRRMLAAAALEVL